MAKEEPIPVVDILSNLPLTPATPSEPEDEQREAEAVVELEDFGAVVQERDRLAKEHAELREKWARLEERQRTAAELASQREAEEVAAERPDPEYDPFGARVFDLEQSNRHLREAVERAERESATQVEALGLNAYLANDVQSFQAQHPDYQQAARYGTEKRAQFWQGLGFTPEQAINIVAREVAFAARTAARSGRSAAAQFYELAKGWGYQPNGPQAQTRNDGAKRGPSTSRRRSRNDIAFLPAGELARLGREEIDAIDEDTFATMLGDREKARALNSALARLDGVA